MKTLSLVLTALLLTMAMGFVFEYTQTCFKCNTPLQHHVVTDELTQPELIFAAINIIFAILSVYFIARRKYIINAIVSGMAVGLQGVFFGMIFLLTQ